MVTDDTLVANRYERIGGSTMSTDACLMAVCSTNVERKLVSQEDLAVRVGSGEATKHEERAFRDCIAGLLHRMAFKYVQGSQRDAEDLVQDCWLRILAYLGSYNPKKAKLTTWVWWVCRSVLNRDAELSKRERERFCHADTHTHEITKPSSPQQDTPELVTFRSELCEALGDLFKKHVDEQDILIEMFGNPFDEGRLRMDSICCADVARNVGRQHTEVYQFYIRKVRPFLQMRLAEYGVGAMT
jgi:RNA polymerase sigma factor (sigma-70 family)